MELHKRHGAYLPHWTQPGATYAITFRLFDSLPATILEQWLAERDDIINTARQLRRDLTAHERQRLDFLHSDYVEAHLAQGHGACFMRRPAVAGLVAAALQFFRATRYDLLAWCVMPNHVHAVLRPMPSTDLPQLLHSWKSYTSHEANKLLTRTGRFWADEYYDHLVRDQDDLHAQIRYVIDNPRRACLDPWKWVGPPDLVLASRQT